MVIKRIYSVKEVAGYLRDLIERDHLLSNIWVRGEISNFKKHTSGHMYFVLKDENCCLRCVMFRSRNSRLPFLPANGMRVLARGAISVFERDGLCQLYVDELTSDGLGSLYLAYCRLKNRLEEEGLFAKEHKKPLPFLPCKIGVITSPDSAAWRDLFTVMRRRFPGIPLVLAPSAVQGEQAPDQIVAAIEALNKRSDLDLIIIGRGGGSIEELWAFNTEEVARAIFHSRIPIISAVGHETDSSISDLVADLRAPTPSAAAELAVPCRAELENKLCSLYVRLGQASAGFLRKKKVRLDQVAEDKLILLLKNFKEKPKKELRILNLRLQQRMRLMQETVKGRLNLAAGKLDLLSPLAVLKRGYCLCYDPYNKRIIRSSKQVKKGDEIEIILAEGGLQCQIREVKKETNWKY